MTFFYLQFVDNKVMFSYNTPAGSLISTDILWLHSGSFLRMHQMSLGHVGPDEQKFILRPIESPRPGFSIEFVE